MAAPKPYVVLLRGINVGGRNVVPMADLRAAFAEAGFESVATYIQSGNVVLTDGGAASTLERRVETMLEARYGVPIVVVARSLAQLSAVVDDAPEGFGASPDTYHSDVIFLKTPLTSADAMRVVKEKEGVDQAWAGNGVLYFARLSARRTESRLSSVMGTKEYASMTVRNWNTTTKLLAMLEQLP